MAGPETHVQELVARYTRRTAKSKQLAAQYRRCLADSQFIANFRFPLKEMVYPIVGARAAGSRMWDVDGNEYVDVCMGFGVHLFGHAPGFVREALSAQLERSTAIGPQAELSGEVAALFCEVTGTERVFFSNTGTEAVMTALRLARTATGREKVAMFSGSFHGHADSTLMATAGDGPEARPSAAGVPRSTAGDMLVLKYGEPRSLEILKERRGEIAAVLVEPVQGLNPGLQPKEFLQDLRTLTASAGIALVFDEVVTGFRIHPGGAQAWFGVQADLATYGKIVGGGMHIGAVAGKSAFMDGVDGGVWSYGDYSVPCAMPTMAIGTFCKHPLTMAAAHAVLSRLKVEGPALQEGLNRRAAGLAARLRAITPGGGLRVAAFGSLVSVVLDAGEHSDLLRYHLIDRGVFLRRPEWFISTAHTDEDLDHLVRAVSESVDELRAHGVVA